MTKVKEVDAPILDPVAVAIKTAEMIVDMEERLGLPSISRAGIYALADRATVEKVRARFSANSVK